MFHFSCYLYKCTCTHIYIFKQNLFSISHLLPSLPLYDLLVEIRHQLLKRSVKDPRSLRKGDILWPSEGVCYFTSAWGLASFWNLVELGLRSQSSIWWCLPRGCGVHQGPLSLSTSCRTVTALLVPLETFSPDAELTCLIHRRYFVSRMEEVGDLFKVMWKWRLHAQILSPDVQSGPHFMIGTREIQIPFSTSAMF